MTSDELAEIDGVKPNITLTDGEEKEVKSATSKSVYKVKRTMDHYFCSCPAWRNQSGAPVNARSCKHLKSLLGDSYEDARVKLKNPDGASAKAKAAPKKKAAPAAKAKAAPKRKRAADEDEEDDAKDEDEAEPAKRARKPASRGKGADVDSGKPASRARKAPTSRGKSKAQNENGNDDQEDQAKVEEEEDMKPAKKGKPASKARKPVSRVKTEEKVREDEEGEGTNEGHDGQVDSEASKPSSSKEASGEVAQRDDIAHDDPNASGPADATDELAEINGVKPKVYLADGDETEVGSMTSNSKYKVKRTWDHYYCTCPAWRNQGGVPVNARSCKHLKSLLGDKYEEARVKLKNPDGPPAKGAAKPASKRKRGGDGDDDDKPIKRAKGKGKAGGDDEDDDDDEPASSSKKQPDLLLANKWDLDTGIDPTGWWISEKLDGVRAYFDGKRMISRLGNPFTPPQWFLDKLPKDVTLDGELFGGRGQFQSTVSIVKTVNSPHWKNITFQIFDIPSSAQNSFEDRLDELRKLFGPDGVHKADQVEVVEHEIAQDRAHVFDKLKEVEALGGEGLMLRKPKSIYEGHRSSTLLKVKTFYDAEAVVTGYVPGQGRHKGRTGALQCKMESGKTFNVGSGLSDKQRDKPPRIGSIITYRFQELTRDGVPRFPSFIGEAADKDKPVDAEIPPHRRAGNKAMNHDA
ncbi:hypothetical protein HGRIS_006031 [Hohenbuehelia grisea]|uniref:SWIM-type domain-containing protein n=1 Tax=Hohenbuehelia grisea TaxID=104357 RepID=A0ABR3JZT3_9AGAR